MRIGIRLGGAMFGVIVTMMGTTTRADSAERVVAIPLGGSLEAQMGDHHFGVYIPTRFGGELTITSTEGKVEEIKGPNGVVRTNGQDVGMDQHGWFTFRVVGAKKPYQGRDQVRPDGAECEEALELLLLADEGRRDARALGRRQRPGRHDRGQGRRRPAGLSRELHRARARTSFSPAPTACWSRCRPPATTPPGFPNLYDDLTWLGPKNTLYQTPSPLLKYDQLFGTSARQWEARYSQNNDISRWPGHCLGGAVASIALQ